MLMFIGDSALPLLCRKPETMQYLADERKWNTRYRGNQIPEKETSLLLFPKINQFGVDNERLCGKIISPPVECFHSSSRGIGDWAEPLGDFCREYICAIEIRACV